MLFGRSSDRAHIRAALDQAGRGRGRALVLRGPPGIGKTALLEDVVRDANGFQVLRARGVESESRLAFAGLSDLLRPRLELLASVPAAQRAALRAALALGPPAAPDRFAAYAATLSLIGALEEAEYRGALTLKRGLTEDPVADLRAGAAFLIRMGE